MGLKVGRQQQGFVAVFGADSEHALRIELRSERLGGGFMEVDDQNTTRNSACQERIRGNLIWIIQITDIGS